MAAKFAIAILALMALITICTFILAVYVFPEWVKYKEEREGGNK